jgi:DNA-binding IclR family transcriptional regulator
MATSRSMRLVTSALRCYPQRWRSRHGDEATEIATLLIQDGTPAWSIAWSYLVGAARARLVTGPRHRLGAAAAALLLLATGSLGASLALLSMTAPASAASSAHTHAARDPGLARPWRTGPRHASSGAAPERCGQRDHC